MTQFSFFMVNVRPIHLLFRPPNIEKEEEFVFDCLLVFPFLHAKLCTINHNRTRLNVNYF